jgi:translation initiation factor RLI1
MMQMTRKTALLDYTKCVPGECPGGVCAAVQICPSRLLKQEEPYFVPMTEPSFCRACGECVRACPMKAIEIVSL